MPRDIDRNPPVLRISAIEITINPYGTGAIDTRNLSRCETESRRNPAMTGADLDLTAMIIDNTSPASRRIYSNTLRVVQEPLHRSLRTYML
jgi:hypothetical protein